MSATPTKRKRRRTCRNCGKILETEYVVRWRRYWPLPNKPEKWSTMANSHCKGCAVDLAEMHDRISHGWEHIAVEVPR
jgi:hypothetical protein